MNAQLRPGNAAVADLSEVGLDQKLNEQLPLDTLFRDESGKTVKLGDYFGKKPVHWCPTCRTALAEAEVKYDNHRSPSIYVKFRMVSSVEKILRALKGKTMFVIIWTTTPWTIPANLGIALHPDLTYVATEVDGDVYIVAGDRLDEVMKKIGKKQYRIMEKFSGATLEGLKCRHPYLDRDSVIILAPYVTLEARHRPLVLRDRAGAVADAHGGRPDGPLRQRGGERT